MKWLFFATALLFSALAAAAENNQIREAPMIVGPINIPPAPRAQLNQRIDPRCSQLTREQIAATPGCIVTVRGR
jgi:hypothetical protein